MGLQCIVPHAMCIRDVLGLFDLNVPIHVPAHIYDHFDCKIYFIVCFHAIFGIVSVFPNLPFVFMTKLIAYKP